jgi:hypothetical protein
MEFEFLYLAINIPLALPILFLNNIDAFMFLLWLLKDEGLREWQERWLIFGF